VTTPRLFLDADLKAAWRAGGTAKISREQARYLREVLRLRAGDAVIAFDGTGGEFVASIARLSRDGGELCLQRFVPIERELDLRIVVMQALLKGDRLDWALQKSVEMGAAKIVLFAARRSVVRLTEEKLAHRLQRWQRIVQEAAEQSGRTRMPDVLWLPSSSQLRPEGLGLWLDLHATAGWSDRICEIRKAETITLLVGPEGGWADEERKQLAQAGFMGLRFGTRTLRAETAAPALLAAIAAVHPLGVGAA